MVIYVPFFEKGVSKRKSQTIKVLVVTLKRFREHFNFFPLDGRIKQRFSLFAHLLLL